MADGRFATYDGNGNKIIDTDSYVYKVIGTFWTNARSGTHTDNRLLQGVPWAICGAADVAPGHDSLRIDLSASGNTISYNIPVQKYIQAGGRYTQYGEKMGPAKFLVIYGVK